jgi:hypothetical protein
MYRVNILEKQAIFAEVLKSSKKTSKSAGFIPIHRARSTAQSPPIQRSNTTSGIQRHSRKLLHQAEYRTLMANFETHVACFSKILEKTKDSCSVRKRSLAHRVDRFSFGNAETHADIGGVVRDFGFPDEECVE